MTSKLAEKYPHTFEFDFDSGDPRRTMVRMHEVEDWLMVNAEGLSGWTVTGEACTYRMTYWIRDHRVAARFKTEFGVGESSFD